MSLLPRINVGTVGNDGTGDKLKAAGVKINQAFATLEPIMEDAQEAATSAAASAAIVAAATVELGPLVDLASTAGTGIVRRGSGSTWSLGDPILGAEIAPILADGATVARTIEARAGERLSVYDFGYEDGDDVAVAINAFNNAAFVASGARLRIPAGEYSVRTSIVPKAYRSIIGDGPQSTRFVVETDSPYAQTAGTQLVGSGISGVSFSATSGHEDAVLLSLTAAQQCVYSNLRFYGFTSGKILRIAGAVISASGEPAVLPATSSNIIFNVFENWVAIGVGTGVEIKGHYGPTPTGSPANSSNIPDVVVTANVYRNMTFYNTQTKGIDIIGACDSEWFENILINLGGNNAIGVDIASDATYTGNNYCNSHRGSFTFSKLGSPTGVRLIRLGWTFGNDFDVEHDIDTSTVTTLTDTNSQSHIIRGKRLSTVGNTLMEVYHKGVTHAQSGTPPQIRTHRTDPHGDLVKVGEFIGAGMDSAGARADFGSLGVYAIQDDAGNTDGQVRITAPVAGASLDHAWFFRGAFGIRDAVTTPATSAGITWLYRDTADGVLKSKNGSGTVETLAILTADLAALEALSGTGFPSRTASNTWAQRSLTAPAAGLTITNPAGVAGDPTFALANDLAALEGLGSTGIAVRSASDTWVQRSLTAPAAGLTITNPAGVAGDPTFALANDLAALEGLGSTGIAVRSASDTWVQRSVVGTTNQISVANGNGVSGDITLSLPTTIAVNNVQAQHFLLADTAFDNVADLRINENLSANRLINLIINDANRTINLAGDLAIAGAFATSGAFGVTLTATALTNVTLPTTGTLATLAGAEALSNKTTITATGAITGASFNISGNQVVGARDTGWAAMTGTPNENTSYDTSSVTLPQLAGRVMALQAALTTHGLIGA